MTNINELRIVDLQSQKALETSRFNLRIAELDANIAKLQELIQQQNESP